jgi:hypothetical protein
MGSHTMPAEPVTIEPPRHPLPALTSYELRDYRRELERAIAFFDEKDLTPPARARLRASLDDVIAEQDERAGLASA